MASKKGKVYSGLEVTTTNTNTTNNNGSQPVATYTTVNMPDPNQYKSVGDLGWVNYKFTPQEMLDLNKRGLLTSDENALKAVKDEWGKSGYVDAVNSARKNSIDATNRQYNDNARSYYQMYKQNQNRLPENLSRLGVTGGASETASLGLLNNYSGNIYNNASQRAQQVSNLNATYDQLVAENSKELANLLIDTYLNAYTTNKGENWGRGRYNNQGLNDQNRYNNEGINSTNKYNFENRQNLANMNTDTMNEFLRQYWANQQNTSDNNVGLNNEYSQTERERMYTLASYLFETTGDASLLKQFGLSDKQINDMKKAWEKSANGTSGGSGGGRSGGRSGGGSRYYGYGGSGSGSNADSFPDVEEPATDDNTDKGKNKNKNKNKDKNKPNKGSGKPPVYQSNYSGTSYGYTDAGTSGNSGRGESSEDYYRRRYLNGKGNKSGGGKYVQMTR